MQFGGPLADIVITDNWLTEEGTPEDPVCRWIGSKIKPIDEELKVKKVEWKDGDRKILTKGQRRKLAQKVDEMENEDLAMRSTLRSQRASFSRDGRR